jgi:uncharacterized membrane protein YphA (DoxX/SURF4 family)
MGHVVLPQVSAYEHYCSQAAQQLAALGLVMPSMQGHGRLMWRTYSMLVLPQPSYRVSCKANDNDLVHCWWLKALGTHSSCPTVHLQLLLLLLLLLWCNATSCRCLCMPRSSTYFAGVAVHVHHPPTTSLLQSLDHTASWCLQEGQQGCSCKPTQAVSCEAAAWASCCACSMLICALIAAVAAAVAAVATPFLACR